MAELPLEEHAEGAWVHTDDGRRLLNCGGYGVLTLGARHPAVVAAVAAQLQRLPISSRTLPHAGDGAARAALASTLPAELGDVFFAVTGAEAVELALRLVRLNGCTTLIACTRAFHGRTLGALSVNGSAQLRKPYEPLLGGVEIVAYDDVDALDRALSGAPGRAAVVLEPVQGEAGVIVPRPGYLTAVAERCAAHEALLVVDEVQTGLGRLGHWWGIERDGIVPDVLVAGKALGGGVLPVSAVTARSEVARPFRMSPRQASSTFGGYPLGAAAVIATIAAMRDEGTVEAARRTGSTVAGLLAAATGAAVEDATVRDVRGVGLLHGVELDYPRTAVVFASALLDGGVVCCHSSASSTTVRLTPPAVLDGEAVATLERALAHAVGVARADVAARRRRRSSGGLASMPSIAPRSGTTSIASV
ncbi:MAG TPA: aminotransferase class III-fold pyridoxal phosphate-dependent enzyme [Solirubrobacteraceae bacterium]|jgi:putrescine aminotransferase|nr:aminotransferase class III-fold pyridoxal phosphate-dependent enzyme [Solirubrobacteraceae bacterium]